jgi:tetratricopeptide (TPR) repeat protein
MIVRGKLRRIFLTVVIAPFLFLLGCMTYRSDWEAVRAEYTRRDVSRLLELANSKANSADSKVAVKESIQAYEEVLQDDPLNYQALSTLAHLYLLLGDEQGNGIPQKKDFYLKAIKFAEHAMYINQDFRHLIDKGEPVWEAVRVLTERELEPMLFWTTGIFYYYKDCLGAVGQVINFHWIKRAQRVIQRMSAIDPDYAGGAIHFTWALYYLAIPESVGGDAEKSKELFVRAIETGPNWLLNRWGRAKYFHVKMKNREEFIEDLQWVTSQDIRKVEGNYAWKSFYKRDAERMLENIDKLF